MWFWKLYLEYNFLCWEVMWLWYIFSLVIFNGMFKSIVNIGDVENDLENK